MKIQKLVLGAIDNNTYLLSNGDHGLIIDPSDGLKRIEKAIEGLTIEGILLTHAHWDHIYSMQALKEKTGAKVYMHRDDETLLMSSCQRIRSRFVRPDVLLSGGETLELIGETIHVLHTPGHSMGSVCYIIGNDMFCGDTIFKGSVGRTDLETSQPEAMEKTLAMFREMKEDYHLYCGHGDDTTLKDELQTNPFLKVR